MRALWPSIGAGLLAIVVVAGIAAWQARPDEPTKGKPIPPPAPGAAPAFEGDRPNVVLVIGCTVRRDQLTPYGGPETTTPFLAEVAANGGRFTDALSAAPWTRPASTAIITGHPFREIGMAEPAKGNNLRKLAPPVTTLAEVFQNAGYATIGATANPNLNRVFGFNQGFEKYYQSTELWRFGMKKVPGVSVVDRVLPEIDNRTERDAPVYVQVLLLDAHQPGTMRPDEAAIFDTDESVPPQVREYRALLHRFDNAVRRLWTGLAARGFDDSNTVFVVVSDHGEGLRWPENQGKGHGNHLVSSVLQMTWLVRGKGVGDGVTVDGLASQIDVFPTIAGLAGVPGYDGPGHDWSAQLRDGGRTNRTYAFVDTDYKRSDRSAVFSETQACEMNFRMDEPVPSCWTRTANPDRTVSSIPPDETMVAELKAWRAAQATGAESFEFTENAFPTAHDRKMLRQLGYVDDPEAPEGE